MRPGSLILSCDTTRLAWLVGGIPPFLQVVEGSGSQAFCLVSKNMHLLEVAWLLLCGGANTAVCSPVSQSFVSHTYLFFFSYSCALMT